MQRAILGLAGVGLIAAGLVLIWSGHGCFGCAAMLCGGAAAGLRQASGVTGLGDAMLLFGGFLLFLLGGFALYVGQVGCGILITLLAAVPWYLGCKPGDPASTWTRLFSFACFAFWTFAAAFLLSGKILEGGILLAASAIPWYALERVRGGRIMLSASLLGEVAAWCGAAAATARQHYVAAAAFIALFFISRLMDGFLRARQGHARSGGVAPLSFRAYLNLTLDEARRLKNMAAQK